MDQLQRCLHKGMLLKRCRLSWRPRYVEMILDPGSLAGGHTYSHQLVLYDQHRHMSKNRISFEDLVTVRSFRDCIFQVFISDGKILQFRTDSMESQAHWMAALKVGLGKGHIFHVRVHTSSGLDHALLYSIGVNLPAHRVGQLDRVLVLASPINDINLNAWDLNRVKAFMESDVGIRMEICPSCIREGQSVRITFIMEKKFINDCMQFLLREARIRNRPQFENGLKIYTVPHQCGYIKQPDIPAPPLPPPYTEDDTQPPHLSPENSHDSKATLGMFNSPSMGTINPAYPVKFWDESTDSGTGSFSRDSIEIHTQTDGTLNVPVSKKTLNDFHLYVPPRTIPRLNHESSIPASAQPYLKYQPHMYHQSRSHYEGPYQISSRIIITDSGEVQFERNIMGNLPPQENGGLLFKKQLPLPPRGIRANPKQPPSNSPKVLSRSNFIMESTSTMGGTFSKVINVEVQPSQHGVRFLREEANKRKAPTPPPEVPPHPTYNLKQERFISTALGGQLVHQLPPLHAATPCATVAEATHPQLPISSQVLTIPPTRLTQSTSETGLAAKAANYSITTLFPKARPALHKRSIKRTSSDSELSTFTGRGESQYKHWISMYGNQTVAGIKSASMKRASQVSDTSDVYIIPTPPSSTTSFRESENPISPSYVTESEFLRDFSKTNSPLSDNNDSAFLPEEGECHYENDIIIKQMMSTLSSGLHSSVDCLYDDVFSSREEKSLHSSVSVPTNSTTSKYRNLDASYSTTSEMNINNSGIAKLLSPSEQCNPTHNPQQRKPRPHPRRNTMSSSSFDVPETSKGNENNPENGISRREQTKRNDATAHVFIVSSEGPNTPLSPKHVTFQPKEERTTALTPRISTPQLKSRSLPRKPPVPKPRKQQNMLTTKTNLPSLSHLSTSDGELGGSLELKDSRHLSKSSFTMLYRGIEVGVTDL